MKWARHATASAIFLEAFVCPNLCSAQTISFERYHSLAEIEDYLTEVCATHSEICDLHEIGVSQRGRRLITIELGLKTKEDKPVIFLNGTHHGDEKSSTESVLGIIDFLVNHQSDAAVSYLFESFTVIIQPVVNPDGHVAHSRLDAADRDPNRDYSFPERDDENSFRAPEIVAIRDYLDGRDLFAAAAFHSGMEGVLWPWCYTGTSTTDHDAMRELSRRFATGMSMRLYRQSFYDYPTRGEFIDYAYMRYGALGVTVEVSNEASPSERRLAAVVTRALTGTLAFLKGLIEYDRGRLDVRPRFDDNQIALN